MTISASIAQPYDRASFLSILANSGVDFTLRHGNSTTGKVRSQVSFSVSSQPETIYVATFGDDGHDNRLVKLTDQDDVLVKWDSISRAILANEVTAYWKRIML
jgi:hypothetical protein